MAVSADAAAANSTDNSRSDATPTVVAFRAPHATRYQAGGVDSVLRTCLSTSRGVGSVTIRAEATSSP